MKLCKMTFWLCNTLIYVLIFWFQRLVSVEQCDLISSSSTWGCVLCCLLFQVDFSQGFVDFFVLVPVSIPAYWVVKWWLFFFVPALGGIQLHFTEFQGNLLCFSSQIVLYSNASWKTLKMLLVWCLHPVIVSVLKAVRGWCFVNKFKRCCSVCC